MTLLLLAVACVPFGKPPPPPVEPTPTELPAETAAAPVSFAPLEQRVAVLLADVHDADARDRLEALRELLLAMRAKDPSAQKIVYDYADRVLAVEERARPQPLPEGAPTMQAPIEEEPIPDTAPPPTVAPMDTARAAMKEGRYLDAIAALEGAQGDDAKALRKEAVDAWARAERERAGHLYLSAKDLPPGPDRVKALTEARDALAAINARFPDNAYAAQIRDNLARVEADLQASK